MNDPEAIPLQKVVSAQSTGARRPSATSAAYPTSGDGQDEKSHHFRRGLRRRRDSATEEQKEEGALNLMGKIYNKVLNFSLLTRYFLYVLPIGLLLAVPIVIGATVAKNARIGGSRMVWFFTWIEILWVSFWATKLFAHILPYIFQFVAGIVSSKIRRYALMIRALEFPLSFIGWAVVSFVTFTPVVIKSTDGGMRNWQRILRQILAAILVCTIVFFVEKFIVQVISVNYHNKQFGDKIKENKRNVILLAMLYEASKKAFPEYCQTFYHEDAVINDSLNLSKFSKKGNNKNSGSVTPMRLLHNIGRVGDAANGVIGNIVQDMTGGARLFDSGTSLAIVQEALEKQKSSEALARRIWMSFVCEGSEALHVDDLIDVLGSDKQTQAEECMVFLDKDANGDVSLEEMILMVRELGRSIKSIASSKHDVDQALKVLDRMLLAVVLIVSVLVFIAFLNQSFVTSLATAGTAILSLSFVFAATAQEVLGSCIFLFVKHPFDVGDRVDLTNDQLTVEHISLLFTVFKRVQNGKLVQIPNIVLNSVWVDNITRSKAMRESILLYCNFDTTFEDIEALRQEMANFVADPANSRDFQPDIEIQVTGIAEMNKMELRIECCHKSNWSNETIRAARRSKFMCALVLAIRKVPIYGPGAGGAPLGSIDQPSYSVSVSPDDAAAYRANFDSTKDAKRLYPKKKPEDAQSRAETDYSGITANYEMRAMQSLTSRNPAVDRTRDEAFAQRGDTAETSALDERRSLDEVRGLLHRESTRGRRHPNQLPPVMEPPRQQTYPMMPSTGASHNTPSQAGVPAVPPVPGNAFSVRRDFGSAGQPSPVRDLSGSQPTLPGPAHKN